ncbi:putative transporter [Hyphomonas neptunium ATCC 15444]|uniref:Putative transporter n=2 Tax=Hyphomonas TaxID=85 RepID=Q0BWY8_HYPNA|nr:MULTISPECIES: fused MFS/spermidine synthase [Hyphomonas]ABI78450.1 putative transporter [Hyphomonas neptunium ATCC 15444]KCZ91995.1 putative transporter [Hyphomonas hirschiana VP5]
MSQSSAAIAPPGPVLHRWGSLPFVVTVFLSAALVFLVQPMFARMATPLLGGSPNVWNVSLVCFQAALLAGYAYAHMLTHLVKSVRNQVIAHGALLVAAALVLPFELTGLFGSPDPARPALWLIGVFALSIAPPFAIISATAPLIQAWYARTGREDAHDPYHLYAASNAGSLLGLAAYPLLLEPLAPLAGQAMAWSLGYGVLLVLLIGCGLLTMRAPLQARLADVSPEAAAGSPALGGLWRQRLWWLVLAFVPSSLLVGVTTHIATDVASAPFLWAPPLMLYIASFIVVFSKRPVIGRALSLAILPVFVGLALFTLTKVSGVPTLLSFFVHLGALFFAAVACHGLMADDRPETGRLTEFYLLMSLGGVLGGAFNALLVPVIFNSVAEYPLMLLAVLLLLPQRYWLGPTWMVVMAAVAGGTALIAMYVYEVPALAQQPSRSFFILLTVSLVLLYLVRRSRLACVAAAASIWAIGVAASPTVGAYSERGFFGVVKVHERDGYRVMVHGTTLHGAQALGEDAWRPATYYAPETPIGQVFAAHTRPGRVGALGLGVGSVACYAGPGQQYTFYEIDPIVARLAKDAAQFTYLSECAPDADIVLGDGRLTLADEPEGAFDILLIDAFSSDSVPAHLMTREAVSLYLSRLKEDGVVLLHVSNRYMALETVVARIAGELGVPARAQYRTVAEEGYRAQSSVVVALARNELALAPLDATGAWGVLESDGGRAWTDDYSNIPGSIWDRLVHKKR